jgi:hypothetical protein
MNSVVLLWPVMVRRRMCAEFLFGRLFAGINRVFAGNPA